MEKSSTKGRRRGIPVDAVGVGAAAFVENCPEWRVERSDWCFLLEGLLPSEALLFLFEDSEAASQSSHPWGFYRTHTGMEEGALKWKLCCAVFWCSMDHSERFSAGCTSINLMFLTLRQNLCCSTSGARCLQTVSCATSCHYADSSQLLIEPNMVVSSAYLMKWLELDWQHMYHVSVCVLLVVNLICD